MTPSFIDTERALLCALIMGSKETQEWVTAELTFRDFSKLEHQRTFKAVQSILDEGLEVNTVSVKDRAKLSQVCLDDILQFGTSKPGDIRTYIQDVRKTSHSRQLESNLLEAMGQLKGSEDPVKVLEALEAKLYGGAMSGTNESTDSTDAGSEACKRFLDRVEGKGEAYLSTGLKKLDTAILGFSEGQNIVVGARPGNGKTAFALTEADNVLIAEPDAGVLFFTREMTPVELENRHLAMRSGVGVRKIKSGKNVTSAEMVRVMEAVNNLPKDRFRINSKCSSMAQVARVARMEKARMARKGIKLRLVIVDYLQLYCASEENAIIGEASRTCKMLAMDLGCVVLTLSQLNRAVEMRDDKRPLPSDLRGSGSIEQDADIILFLFRPWVYNKALDEEYAEVIVAKQRDGPQGPVPVRFVPRLTHFVEWDEPEDHGQPASAPGEDTRAEEPGCGGH